MAFQAFITINTSRQDQNKHSSNFQPWSIWTRYQLVLQFQMDTVSIIIIQYNCSISNDKNDVKIFLL